MTAERPTWADGHPDDTAACVRCREVKDTLALDRMLWCDGCRRAARERAAWWGWLVGLVFGGLVAAYVYLAIRPTDLVVGGWVATVVAAVWIGGRIGREVVYGIMRYAGTRVVDGPPPGDPPRGDPARLH